VSESASSQAKSVYTSSHTRTPITPCHSQASQIDVSNCETAKINQINLAQVLAETAALENYFQDGFGREINNDEGGESKD
jgi:hypothetical protein